MMSTQLAVRAFRDKYLWAVLAISAVMLALVLVEPFGADNAVLHSMALDWVKQGKIPYIGSWDNNFPGIVYVHSLSIILFGPTDFGYRLFDLCIQLFFAGFLYQFLLRWLKPHTAALAAVIYIAYYVSASVDLYGKQDDYGMMAILVGVSMILPRAIGTQKKWIGLVVGAAVCGISLLMRPTFLLFIGLICLAMFLGSDRRFAWSGLLPAITIFLSSLLPVGCVLLYYSSIPSGLMTIYNSTIRFNLDVYASLGTTSKFWWELLRTGLMIPLTVYALSRAEGTLSSVVRTPELRERVLYAAFVFSAVGVVVLMGKYYRYHLAPFFLLLSPLAAVGLEQAITFAATDLRRHFALLAGVFFCSFIGYNPTAPLAFSLGVMTKTDPFARADVARRPDPKFGAITEKELLDYLRLPNNREGAIEVCSFAPFLRYHLQREPAGPYITFHALAFRTDGTRMGAPHYMPYQLQWQKDYMDSLVRVRPHFMILARKMPFWYIQDVYDDCLRYLPGFDSLLSTSYRYDTSFGGFQLYRRVTN